MLITICQNKPFGITGIMWKAITVLCGFSSLFYVFFIMSCSHFITLLCYVVSPVCLVVTSIRYVVLQYVLKCRPDVMSFYHNVV